MKIMFIIETEEVIIRLKRAWNKSFEKKNVIFYSVFDLLLNYVNHICDVASVEYDMLYRKKMKNVISFNATRTIKFSS